VRKKLLVQAVLRSCSQHVAAHADHQLAAGAKSAAPPATPVSAESAADILDLTAFETLAEAIDFDDAIETYQVFVKDARRGLNSLSTMELDANRKLVRLEAHTLKSIAASFGFNRMSKLAMQLESAALEIPEPEFRSIIPRMDDAFERGKAQFDEAFSTAA
jgi:HPt (histidine-containing phosphotransfer) domain-containing protein